MADHRSIPAYGRARARERERGFTLVEVLVALLIVATTLGALLTISSDTLRSAVGTNRVRIAKMLLRQKAEQVCAGLEQGSAGSFDGFPGYEWEVTETEVPVAGETDVPESVRYVTVAVRMPGAGVRSDGASEVPETEDGPGQVCVATLLDPPEAELKPSRETQQTQPKGP